MAAFVMNRPRREVKMEKSDQSDSGFDRNYTMGHKFQYIRTNGVQTVQVRSKREFGTDSPFTSIQRFN